MVFPLPIPLYCRSQATLYIDVNMMFHERIKHLDIECHIVRDQFKQDFISLHHVSSSNQLANYFTKGLSAPSFRNDINKLGLLDCYLAST